MTSTSTPDRRAHQVSEQQLGRLVGPLDVVEHEQQPVVAAGDRRASIVSNS